MKVSLHLLKLEQLRSLRAGSTQVDGFRVLPGAAYQAGIIDRSIAEVKAGHNPVWHSQYFIVDAEGRHAIGMCGFHQVPDRGRVEIGYGVAPSRWGQGIATEAVRRLIEIAFRHSFVTEVCARSEVGNIASRRVLEKSGFKHTGDYMDDYHGHTDRWLLCREQ